jgi:hypothetical protein
MLIVGGLFDTSSKPIADFIEAQDNAAHQLTMSDYGHLHPIFDAFPMELW